MNDIVDEEGVYWPVKKFAAEIECSFEKTAAVDVDSFEEDMVRLAEKIAVVEVICTFEKTVEVGSIGWEIPIVGCSMDIEDSYLILI